MLVFNLRRVLALRGIVHPQAFLTRIGLHRSIAAKLGNNRSTVIKISHLDLLCRTLNCAPSDLFEWKPEAEKPLPEAHPLNALVREKTAQRISQIMRDIPLEKLDRLEEVLARLETE